MNKLEWEWQEKTVRVVIKGKVETSLSEFARWKLEGDV